MRKRGKKEKKKKKKTPSENDEKGILAEGLPVGNSEVKDDPILMPVVVPEDIPLPDNETEDEEPKLEACSSRIR